MNRKELSKSYDNKIEILVEEINTTESVWFSWLPTISKRSKVFKTRSNNLKNKK